MTAPSQPISYSELPTPTQWIDCTPPYSFYFDMVAAYWRASYTPISFHRLCTLARKQGANFVVVESIHGRPDIVQELSDMDKACGTGGAAEAIKLTFIHAGDPSTDIALISDGDILGQAILINYKKPAEAAFTCSYIYEALFTPPAVRSPDGVRTRLLNNHISTERPFNIDVLTKSFTINAAYYCQQNSITHACAQACLRMSLNTMPLNASQISGSAINAHLNPASPGDGLNLGEIYKYITDSGLGFPQILVCASMPTDQYLSVMDSYVQSGLPALLIFSTATQPNQAAIMHVVSVVGSTHNSDEWHPQAIPEYAGPSSAQYRKSSLWTDHFVMHDDNFGPYYTLSARALEVDRNVTAQCIIGISPVDILISANAAEIIASISLQSLLPGLQTLASNQWFNYITTNNYKFVLRPVLIGREKYFSHLTSRSAHNGSQLSDVDTAKISGLPEYFWMVEFSMPALFTGNHSKLGEVLVNPYDPVDSTNIFKSIYHIRFPGLLFSVDTLGSGTTSPFPMVSHVPIYQSKEIANRW